MVAGINASIQFAKCVGDYQTNRDEKLIFSPQTVVGALAKYVSTPNKNYQPMNANFGILPELETKIKDKKQRYEKMAHRSLENITIILQKY